MGTNIENQIVRMEFDNKQFEAGVKESLTTLDRLNQSLELKKMSDRLSDISKHFTNLPTKVFGNIGQSVKIGFSRINAMVDQFVRNTTTKLQNMASQMANSVNIFNNGISSGFREYETQINAVQTIWANTKDAGTTMDDINGALDELNTYADKTIYNFTEMTRNIGTFTAAGVDLETAVQAIQGIANLSAMSGASSMDASRAMYQLSQALATGRVTLMDWNSVVNANIGGKTFQKVLIQTAEELGTISAELSEGLKNETLAFRDTINEGWITSDVLTASLAKFTDTTTELGKTATDAATKVKTFTQLIDTLKEAVSSGWTQTWEFIIGDFQEARELFTWLSDEITAIIQPSMDTRNEMFKYWSETGEFGKKATDKLKEEAEYSEEIIAIAKRVIGGEFSTGQERFDILDQMGYDHREVQNCVNDLLGMAKAFEIEDESAKKADKTNKVLTGREMVIQGLKNILDGLIDTLRNIKAAWKTVFPSLTGARLVDLSKEFMEFTEKLKPSREALQTIQIAFRGLFSVIKMGLKIVSAIRGGIIDGIMAAFEGVDAGEGLSDTIRNIANFFTDLQEQFEDDGTYDKIAEKVKNAAKTVTEAIGFFISEIFGIEIDKEKGEGILDAIEQVIDKLKDIWNKIIGSGSGKKKDTDGETGWLEKVVDAMKGVFDELSKISPGDDLQGLLDWFASIVTAVFSSFSSIFTIGADFIKESGTAGVDMIRVFDLLLKIIIEILECVANILDALAVPEEVTLDDILKASVIFLIIAKGIEILAKAFAYRRLSKSAKKLSDGAVGAMNGLVGGIRQVINVITSFFRSPSLAENKAKFIWGVFAVMVAIFAILELCAGIYGRFGGWGVAGIITGFAGIIAVVKIIESLLKEMDTLNLKDISKIFNSFAIMFVSIGAVLAIVGMIALSVAALDDTSYFIAAFTLMMGVLMSLILSAVGLAEFVNPNKAKDLKRASDFFLEFAAAIAIIAACIVALAREVKDQENFTGLAVAVGALIIITVFMVSSAAVLTGMFDAKDLAGTSASFVILAASMLIIASAIYMLGQLDTGKLIAAGTVFAIVVFIVTYAVGALMAVGAVLQDMTIATLPILMLSIAATLAAFALIAISIGYIYDAMSNFIDSLIAFSEADFTNFGQNIIDAANGITESAPYVANAVASVLAALLAVMPKTIIYYEDDILTTVLQFLSKLLGMLRAFVVNDLVPFAYEVFPILALLVYDGVMSLITFLGNHIGEILGKIAWFIDKLATAIEKNSGPLVDAWFHLVDAIWGFIFSWYGKIVEWGESVVKWIGEGIEAATGLPVRKVISLISKINDLFTYDGFHWLGEKLVTWIAAGIEAAKATVLTAIRNLGGGMVGKLMDTLDENSPSKETEKIGENFSKGLEIGVESSSGGVFDVVKGLGEGIINGLKGEVDGSDDDILGGMLNDLKTKLGLSDLGLGDKLNLGLETSLTPVIDTSKFGVDTSSLTNSFNAGTLGLSDLNSSFTQNPSISNIQNSTFDDSNIVNELTSLRQEVSMLGQRISEMQVVMDTNALVGSIAGPMDAALGRMAMMRGRGG